MKRSLTLIEVMVAALIFTVLALALYSLLKSGSGIRNRLDADDTFTCGGYLNLEAMAREVKNIIAFRQKDTGFVGQAQGLGFYTQSFDYSTGAGFVAQIGYAFKDGTLQKTITRPFTGNAKTFDFMENLSDIEFSYFNGADLAWQQAWSDKMVLPKGVKIEIAYNSSGKQPVKLTKYIWLEVSR